MWGTGITKAFGQVGMGVGLGAGACALGPGILAASSLLGALALEAIG